MKAGWGWPWRRGKRIWREVDMQRTMRMGAVSVLIWALLASGRAVMQGPAPTRTPSRLVVFEAFMRPT